MERGIDRNRYVQSAGTDRELVPAQQLVALLIGSTEEGTSALYNTLVDNKTRQ
jgi:hypothetical protein